jgi:hypothetical protein
MRHAWISVAVLLVLLLATPTRTSNLPERPVMRNAPAEPSPGERWLRVLDNQQAGKQRLTAAKELGRLKYAPAIPVLLKYATVGQSVDRIDEHPSIEYHPCFMALTQFGPEVVEPAAKMYISPTATNNQRECLEHFLRQENPSRSRDATLDQIREFGRKFKNRFEHDRLVELYFRLHKGGEQRFVPREWPEFEPVPPTGGPDRPLDHVRKRVSSIG